MADYMKAIINGFELLVTTPKIDIENNIDALCEFINAKSAMYLPGVYTGDADEAKKDRTEVNKGIDQVYSLRKSIENLNPYAPIEEKLIAAEKLMKKSAVALGDIVHAKEDEEKKAKLEKVQMFWETKDFEIVPLEKVMNIFKVKWLNKSCQKAVILDEMDSIIEKIRTSLVTCEKYAETDQDADLIKACYLEHLDLEEAFSLAEQFKKNRELAKKEAEERETFEHNKEIAEQSRELYREKKQFESRESAENLANEALGIVTETKPKEEMKEFTCAFIATEKQAMAVKQYFINAGIVYNTFEEIKF